LSFSKVTFSFIEGTATLKHHRATLKSCVLGWRDHALSFSGQDQKLKRGVQSFSAAAMKLIPGIVKLKTPDQNNSRRIEKLKVAIESFKVCFAKECVTLDTLMAGVYGPAGALQTRNRSLTQAAAVLCSKCRRA
jgi:hypothetical protein